MIANEPKNSMLVRVSPYNNHAKNIPDIGTINKYGATIERLYLLIILA